MKNYLYFLITIAIFLTFSIAKGNIILNTPNSPDTCTEFHDRYGALDYYRQLSGKGNCFLSVNPNNSQDLVYRSFLFTSNGELLVFNSFGYDDGANGGRVYMFFPRTTQVAIEPLESSVRVSTATPGLSFEFDHKKGIVTDFSWGKFTESADIDPKNKGGLELINTTGLLLDVGFSMGKDPSENKNGVAVFKDQNGQKCSVKNHQIFDYANNDVDFKFTDAQLKVFLKKNCPNISINF